MVVEEEVAGEAVVVVVVAIVVVSKDQGKQGGSRLPDETFHSSSFIFIRQHVSDILNEDFVL